MLISGTLTANGRPDFGNAARGHQPSRLSCMQPEKWDLFAINKMAETVPGHYSNPKRRPGQPTRPKWR